MILGPDAQFGRLDGLVRTRVGYCGGTTADPTHHALGDHTEAFEVDFDPKVVSCEELDMVNATASARINGLLGGYVRRGELEALLPSWRCRRAGSVSSARGCTSERVILAYGYHRHYGLLWPERLD